MIISNSKKFIFIHIFKTGGTSMNSLLGPHMNFSFKLVYWFKIPAKIWKVIELIFGLSDYGQRYITGYHKHVTAQEVRDKMGQSKYGNYFSFCFVRDPYDLMISLYSYIKQHREHKFYEIAHSLAFNEFVIFYLLQKPRRQSDFIFDKNGKCLISKIAKYESINEEISDLSRILGVEGKIQKLNSSIRSKNLADYWTEQKVAEEFERYFALDFEKLGYSYLKDRL